MCFACADPLSSLTKHGSLLQQSQANIKRNCNSRPLRLTAVLCDRFKRRFE